MYTVALRASTSSTQRLASRPHAPPMVLSFSRSTFPRRPLQLTDARRRISVAFSPGNEPSQDSMEDKLFAILDTNANGTLSADEIEAGILDLKILKDEVSTAMASYHSTAIISKSTFVDASATAPLTAEQAGQVFEVLFPENPGYIFKVEFDQKMAYITKLLTAKGIK